MEVGKLTGVQLDYWVARAEGWDGSRAAFCALADYAPSVNWAQGGPIIQRENIAFYSYRDGEGISWCAGFDLMPGDGPGVYMDHDVSASDPLTAAMRAYVTKKFGKVLPSDGW